VSLRQKYVGALAQIALLGAMGLSTTLGAVAPAVASEPPTGNGPPSATREGISEKLAAIRDAVSILDGDRADAAKAEGRLAWGNSGAGYPWFRWPNWNNWHNWHNWHNM
jgi:hypothetical protein